MISVNGVIMRKCPGPCNQIKPINEFRLKKSGKQIGQAQGYCKSCSNIYEKEYNYRTGKRQPAEKNKKCSTWLGEIIAEQVLSKSFKNVKKMPKNNPGFDFICGKGFKIDVKSSCLIHSKNKTEFWYLNIKYNTIAQYFLFLLFDNRDDLNPIHVYLIPGNIVNGQKSVTITNNMESLSKWKKYEKPLDRIIMCCNAMKGGKI